MDPVREISHLNGSLSQSEKLKTVKVTERMFASVFKGVDSTDPEKQIIVKMTTAPSDQVELPRLQPYVRLSEHCNICKLLKYEVIGPSHFRKLVTVMENCGVDLFAFLLEDLKSKDGKIKINLNLILSISLDLLNQIICMQSQNAVHGDIKIENVLIDDKGKATLVDFDELPTITQDATGTVNVSSLTVTEYDSRDDSFMRRAVNYYNTNDAEKQFIMVILSLPDEYKLYMDCNIPPGINDIRRDILRDNSNFTLPNRELANIIDLYSWCYVILIMLWLWVVRTNIDYVFGYRTLLAIIMSILLPNAYPKPVPVDVFNIPINAEYRRRLVLGITVLMNKTVAVANDSCTNNKVRLFLKLIQKCNTAEELSGRFNSIVAANTEFYDAKIDDSVNDSNDHIRSEMEISDQQDPRFKLVESIINVTKGYEIEMKRAAAKKDTLAIWSRVTQKLKDETDEPETDEPDETDETDKHEQKLRVLIDEVVQAMINVRSAGIKAAVVRNEAEFRFIDAQMSAQMSAPSGGRRRRRTHKKTKIKTHRPHACKKGKRVSRVKRMKHASRRIR